MVIRLLSARAIRPTNEWVVAVVVVSASIAAVAIIFGIMAAIRKARRDRNEREQRLRRDAFARSLRDGQGDPNAALAAAVGDQRARTDLIAMMLAYHRDGSDLADLDGYRLLVADLSTQLNSRTPLRRGTAILLLNLLRAPAGVAAGRAGISDRDADVRLASARSLGIVASDAAADALLDALRTRPLPIPAERIIERLNGPWALRPCLDALKRARRVAGAGTGPASGSSSISADPREPDASATLDMHHETTSALDSPTELVRYRSDIARALALIASPDAEPALIELLSSPHAEERINAARALGRCGTRRALGPLQDHLADEAPFVRAQAAKALGELGFDECAQPLTEMMTDRVWWVRSNAATSLGKLGNIGRQALERVANCPDRFAAQRAQEELIFLDHS